MDAGQRKQPAAPLPDPQLERRSLFALHANRHLCGAYSGIQFKITDSGTPNALTATSSSQTITVNVPAITLPATLSPATATDGVAYTGSVAATGGAGALTYSVISGSLPSGLNLNPSTGAITGTPAAVAGPANFTIKAVDSYNDTPATHAYTLTVNPGAATHLIVSVTSSTTITAGGTVSFTVTAQDAYNNTATTFADIVYFTSTDGLAVLPASSTLTSGVKSFSATLKTTGGQTITAIDATDGSIKGTSGTITVTPAPPVFLQPTGGTLPAATEGQAYLTTITAYGGVPPFTWSINGSTVTSRFLPEPDDSLRTRANGNVLTISETPTTTTPLILTNVKVVDNANSSDTQSYTIAANAGSNGVSGNIGLWQFGCNTYLPPPASGLSVNISNGSDVNQNVSANSSGGFSFAGIPNGTYTLTPSYTGPSGSSAVFYPATITNVTVNNGNVTGEDFEAAIGYTVSGTVNYSGSKTGRIYLALEGGCSNYSAGTSISSAGDFSIRGVLPGNYLLDAWMDPSTRGKGMPNVADPYNYTWVDFTSVANYTGANVSINDPTVSTPSSGPTIASVVPADHGVVVTYGSNTIIDTGVFSEAEQFTSYKLEWSTSSSFNSITGSLTFTANGIGGASVIILNSDTANLTGSFADGTAYYYRLSGFINTTQYGPTNYGSSTAVTGGQLASASNCATIAGSTCSAMSGSVIIPAGVTVNGPLYVGVYSSIKGVFAIRAYTTPTVGSNSFTFYAPNGTNYFFFAILDQNNNGLIDAGDLNNINGNTNSRLDISGGQSGLSLDLPGGNSVSKVRTSYLNLADEGLSGVHAYDLLIDLWGNGKMPVAATLTSGPNLVSPIDLQPCMTCEGGDAAFVYAISIGSIPTVGDTYSITVTYSDNSTEVLTPKVTAMLDDSALVTNIAPVGANASTTPTFTWTYPASASDYTYLFYLWQTTIRWEIPASGSINYGFLSSDIPGASITWGTDPTGNALNNISGALIANASYTWEIETFDSNQNSAIEETSFRTQY
jgi:hypothetical protein